MKMNKEIMNTMTAEELEAAEKDLLECNMLLMKFDKEEVKQSIKEMLEQYSVVDLIKNNYIS